MGSIISHGGGSLIDRAGGSNAIPELSSDPSSPAAQSAWVLRSGQGGAGLDGISGTPIGFLLLLTYAGVQGVAYSYQFSYRTTENTTVRAALS